MSTGSLQIQQPSQQEQEQLQQQQQRQTPTKQQQLSPQRQLYNPEEGPSPEATKKVLTEHDLPQVRANPSLIHQRCVCELCSCGKHHCPRPRVKGIFETSYQDHYKQFKFDHPSSMVRPYHYEMKHYGEDQLQTNYQQEYVKKDLPQAHNEAFVPEPAPKRYVPFNDETQYKRKYQQFEQDKQISSPTRFQNVAKNMILRPPVKFNASTSYNDHYKGYTTAEKQSQPNIEYNAEFVRSPIKFEGVSTYKNNYIAPPKVQSRPMAMQYHHASVPFKGQSTYKNHFVPYRVEAMNSPLVAPMITAPPVRFDAKTAYQEQYDSKPTPQAVPHEHERCLCDVLSIPTVNYQDKPHLRFDAARNQWV